MTMGPIQRRLVRAVVHVVESPRRTLLIAGVVVAACAVLAGASLRISTDQNKLFSARAAFFKEYLRFIEKFPENEAVYVLVQTRDPLARPAMERWTGLADAITQQLSAMPQYVRSVDSRVPVEALG